MWNVKNVVCREKEKNEEGRTGIVFPAVPCKVPLGYGTTEGTIDVAYKLHDGEIGIGIGQLLTDVAIGATDASATPLVTSVPERSDASQGQPSTGVCWWGCQHCGHVGWVVLSLPIGVFVTRHGCACRVLVVVVGEGR